MRMYRQHQRYLNYDAIYVVIIVVKSVLVYGIVANFEDAVDIAAIVVYFIDYYAFVVVVDIANDLNNH